MSGSGPLPDVRRVEVDCARLLVEMERVARRASFTVEREGCRGRDSSLSSTVLRFRVASGAVSLTSSSSVVAVRLRTCCGRCERWRRSTRWRRLKARET